MHILIPDARFPDEPDIERSAAPGADFEVLKALATEEVPDDAWRRAEALVLWNRVHITPEVVAKLDRCRLVIRAGIGFDKVDVAACAARGIPVCNCPDYGVTDVADTAMAHFLALARGVAFFQETLKADIGSGWNAWAPPLIGRVRGRRFGVVGLGRIGTAVLRRARAFDMAVAFYDPFVPAGLEQSVSAERMDSLEALLESVDVVSLHVPATRDTHHMIDRAALSRMRPGAILINTSRGTVIDLDALAEAMKDGVPAGAGLDVLPVEPADPGHPLIADYRAGAPWLNGRLLLSPHAAYHSQASLRDMRYKPVETVRIFFEENRLRNCVNANQLAKAGHDFSAALSATRWEDAL